jgi:predicted XRE-type DNA-binding protein
MKITKVTANNRRKAFEIATRSGLFLFPYVEADPSPSSTDPVREAYPDREIGREGFTYVLASGREGTVHMDNVLEYNKDPNYMADKLLYNLTVEARKRVEQSELSTREIIRRLGTSATQFYRLLDQTNYSKSLKQLVALLAILDCEVDLVVKQKRTA